MKPAAVDKTATTRVSRSTLGNPSASWLILGYGNPLRGDDALGPLAAAELAAVFSGQPNVRVQTAHQLTLDMAETLAEYDVVVLIDARAAEPAGQLYSQPVTPAEQLPQAFSHYLTPGELLAAAQVLYQASPRMVLTGINAASFEVGAPFTAAVQQSLPELVAMIKELVYKQLENLSNQGL